MSQTVVVADDDQDIRSLVSIAVNKAGLDLVESASDGAGALAAILQHHPDLAILDVSMPEMTGLEVCRAVRSDPAVDRMHILLLSASVDENSKSIGIEAGADYFFAKPFSPRELAAWLSEREDVR